MFYETPPYVFFRYMSSLNLDEVTEKDKFMEECIADPALRDKMSILNRTFQNKRRVSVV